MPERAPADLIVRTPFLSVMTEWVRSGIAIAIVGGGVAIIVLSLVNKDVAELANTQNTITIMVGLMGAVLGYYFGKTGTDLAQSTAATALNARDVLEEGANETIETLTARLSRRQEALDKVLAWSMDSSDGELLSKLQTLDPEALKA